MPWVQAVLRGTKVFARVDAGGSFVTDVEAAFANRDERALSMLLSGLNPRETYETAVFGDEMGRLDEYHRLSRDTLSVAYMKLYRAFTRPSRRTISTKLG